MQRESEDTCPVCGHLISTGAHRLEQWASSSLPILICPSWSEFQLERDFILYDQDAPPPVNRAVQVYLDGKTLAEAVKPPEPPLE